MRLAILADIHANREAFDAVMDHAAGQGVDGLVCLGDLVGYGADPAYIVDQVRDLASKGAIVIKGNHDEAIALDRPDMNDYAKIAIEWSRHHLNPVQCAFLDALPLTHELDGVLFTHSEASAPDQWHYVRGAREAERSMLATSRRITFCGHIHQPKLYHMAPQKPAIAFTPRQGVSVPLSGNRQWLAVMGSVGQPRDENPDAAYAIYDYARRNVTYHRVNYDLETAAMKIRAAGLPAILSARLYIGR